MMIILMNSTQTRINNKKNNEREDNKILYVRLCNNRRKEEEGWRKYSDEKGKRVRTSKIDKATVWFLLPLPRALRKMNFLVPIS